MAAESAAMQRIRDAGGLRLRRERVAVVEPEPEPPTFAEWWAEESGRLGGATAANIIVSATLAGTATLLILGSIAALALLRREHTWSSPATQDDFDAEVVEDLPHDQAPGDQDDPYARGDEQHARE